MKSVIFAVITVAISMLSACNQQDMPAEADTIIVSETTTQAELSPSAIIPNSEMESKPEQEAIHKYADWAGRWEGTNGSFVEIKLLESRKYKLVVLPDFEELLAYEEFIRAPRTYFGFDGEHGIDFRRGGVDVTLYKSIGDAIGIKYLAGKLDCIEFEQYDGYCRD